MVINSMWNGKSITFSIKQNCLTISIDDRSTATVFSYDNSGRFWTGMKDGISYRRGLNGRIVGKWINNNQERSRRWLTEVEANELIEFFSATLNGLRSGIEESIIILNNTEKEQLLPKLQTAVGFSVERAKSDSSKYHQVYKPVGILPPDQYMALVLQAAEGCSFNTCTFCDFYKGRPFRIKSPEEFKFHLDAIKEYLGEGLSLRRTIFIGDANALVIPMVKLRILLNIVNSSFDVSNMGGIFAFLDGFSGEKKSADDYAELAKLGLKRVYIGMESGNGDLLKFLRKPGTPGDVVRAVQSMKAGGLSVGIIVLLGPGGHRFAEQHIHDTGTILNALDLDADDLIYFSELIDSEGMAYTRDAYSNSLKPLTSTERIIQGELIEKTLKFSLERGTPHISRYDIREFVY